MDRLTVRRNVNVLNDGANGVDNLVKLEVFLNDIGMLDNHVDPTFDRTGSKRNLELTNDSFTVSQQILQVGKNAIEGFHFNLQLCAQTILNSFKRSTLQIVRIVSNFFVVCSKRHNETRKVVANLP